MPNPPTLAAIALGSNLGDRTANLRGAVNALSSRVGCRVVAVSSHYATAPVGGVAQPEYLNGACLVETTLSARELLRVMLEIEREFGRVRVVGERWGPRTLDLDLLVFGQESTDEAGLTLPHPRLHERAFVLEPLREIAPDLHVPKFNRTVAELWRSLQNEEPPGHR